MSGDISGYLSLVPSENKGQPKFTADLSTALQPFADLIALYNSMYEVFDLDSAIGVQEDAVGLWVGRTRYLQEQYDVYFSFDDSARGFDLGIWKGPFDPTTGLAVLPDPAYRILLYATVVANQWDGSVQNAYAAWDTLFAGTGYDILIQDYGDMTMAFALIGKQPDALTLALFTTGELDLKPAGVFLYRLIPSNYDVPIFGFDANTSTIGGFDTGAWALDLATSSPLANVLTGLNGRPLTGETGSSLTSS